MTPVRVAVVNSHPIQYFAPLYAFLNTSPDISVTALYCSDYSIRGAVDPGFKRTVVWDIDLLAGYPSKFLGSRATVRTPRGFWSLIVPEIWKEVRSGAYDAVWLHGHNYAAYWIALFAAKSKGLSVMMRCETHLDLKRTRLKRALRRPLMRAVYGACDAFLAIGTMNKRFYQAMGVPGKQIFLVPYAVDNERFAASATLSTATKLDLKAKFGISPDLPVLLYASKLVARKHPAQVIQAVAKLQGEGLKICALIVGSGEEQADLQQLAAQLQVTNVIFADFINQSDLPQVMGIADVFVLPAEDEPWGLVVNEAMSAGLPVIVGKEVGCAADLVSVGETGYTCIAGDVDSLANALRLIISDSPSRKSMAENAKRRISKWSFNECRDGLRAALAYLSPGMRRTVQ